MSDLIKQLFLSRSHIGRPGVYPYDDWWEGGSGGIGIKCGLSLPSGSPSETLGAPI